VLKTGWPPADCLVCCLAPPQLSELIKAEEEDSWPELVLKCLKQKKKVDGVT